METKTRKRGPKPSGVKKVVFYARVTPEQKLLLEVQLDKFLSGTTVVVGSEGFKGGRESEKEPVITSSVSEVAALLDDIQKLTDEVAGLRVELEECRNLTLDEKSSYWKVRALKAEAYAASKNE